MFMRKKKPNNKRIKCPVLTAFRRTLYSQIRSLIALHETFNDLFYRKTYSAVSQCHSVYSVQYLWHKRYADVGLFFVDCHAKWSPNFQDAWNRIEDVRGFWQGGHPNLLLPRALWQESVTRLSRSLSSRSKNSQLKEASSYSTTSERSYNNFQAAGWSSSSSGSAFRAARSPTFV